MRLPDFLIIGAQKAGTTTLYRDLTAHPKVFFSYNKEPDILADDRVLSKKGRAYYASLFSNATDDQVCGEASTSYSKLPDIAGVPDRALKVLGDQFRVIYIMRDPVYRALSHHYHDLMLGLTHDDVDRAMLESQRFVHYSSYAMQLSPWLDMLGTERISLVKFEDYMLDRAASSAKLHNFLDIEALPHAADAQAKHNTASSKQMFCGAISKPIQLINNSRWYRNRVRSLIPDRLIEAMKSRLMTSPPPKPKVRKTETIERLVEQLAPEMERLKVLLGDAAPSWDLEQTRQVELNRISQSSDQN